MSYFQSLQMPFDASGQGADALNAPGKLETKLATRMAGRSMEANAALKAYQIKADAAEKAAEKSRMPTSQGINWEGVGGALGPIADAILNRGGSADPIKVAYSQPAAWGGNGFSAPDYWGGARAMDAQKVYSTSWNLPFQLQ